MFFCFILFCNLPHSTRFKRGAGGSPLLSSKLLHIMQSLVVAITGNQLLVCTTFHNLSFVQDANLICMFDGTEPMGNSYSGACGHQSFQSILHQTFALGVKSRCASSRMRMGGFFSIARVMEMRCRCPPDSLQPRSPTIVS